MANTGWENSTTTQRARLRRKLLWAAAVILGVVTSYETMMAIHDFTQRDDRVRLLLVATGNRIAGIGAERLELLSRDAMLCQCAGDVGALEFIDVSLQSRSVSRRPLGSANKSSLPTDSSIIAFATDIAKQEGQQLRTATDSTLLVQSVQRDSLGVVTHVVGYLANSRTLARAMFGGIVKANRAASGGMTNDSSTRTHRTDLFGGLVARDTTRGRNPIIALDSSSFEVLDTQGHSLFGLSDTTRRVRANLALTGALQPLTLRITLWSSQIATSIVGGIPEPRLYRIGAFGLSAILVLAIAVGSTRREALLARTRSDFIAGVSHDLRMPLAQILLSGETLALKRERDENERSALASSIVREARRLVGLVDNVLHFARSGAVERSINVRPVAVSELLADSCEAVQLVADDVGQTIVVQSPTDFVVLGDRHLLRQALVNLLDNAIKYGREAQVIHLSAVASAPNTVQLHVDDQGAGIPRADRARLFDAYERLSRDQVSERTGTGLGLAVVRDVVRACNGRVWLDDAPGGGTRAIIELKSATSA